MAEKTKKKKFSRRKFLLRASIGTGVLLGTVYITRSLWRRGIAGVVNSAESPYMGNTKTPLIWFEVTAENRVILHSPKVEMGQGSHTGLAQMAADELDINMDQISVKHAETASGNIDSFATGGSTTISGLWIPLRELAATMREMLRYEAAKQLGVDAARLTIKDGVIHSDDQSLSYGEVVASAQEWEIPKTPPLKPMQEYQFIGQPVPRVDLMPKVMGAPIFGMDASLPDMLFGAVVRSDKVGAKFSSADISEAEKMPGVVKVVVEDDFVGVVAKSQLEAHNAKAKIKTEWTIERDWSQSDIEAMIAVGQGDPISIQKRGNPSKVLEGENIVEAEFKSPIGAHAQIEPNGAVADVQEDHATIIMSTQVVNITRSEVASRLGMKKDQVNIKPTFLGGGFGRRLHTPNAIQAAVLSKAVGKPVKCFFDRKEEFQHDTFRPPTHHILRAKLDENGLISAITHDVSSGDVMFGSPMVPAIVGPIIGADVGAWRGGMIQYGAIPNFEATSWRVKLPFATSWWRSLGLLANTFAIESFMDELAVQANQDPVQFRLSQIQDDERGHRLKEVIKAAAEKANYRDEVKDGRAMGFAASTDANTPCAQVVEVSIDHGEIKVHKVTCAIDPGLAVNPDQVRAQCEGAIIMGMSGAMFEKMEVKDGALQPTIYGPYAMALMKHAPKEIDVVILENDDKPGAVGEPPLGPIGAAIANALYRLTGERLREMPLQLA